MNKFLNIFILLGIIFGFGISCASAENISFVPSTVNLSPGSSQQVQVVMDSVPNGLAGFNITFNVSDPGIANITGVSLPSWANISLSRNSTLPSNGVWIKTIDLDGAKPNHTVVPGATNVILGNITITVSKPGTANLSIQKTLISADGGSTIVPSVIPSIISGNLPILPGCTNPPTDPKHWGFYEDLNGDGNFNFRDVVVFYNDFEWISQKSYLIPYFDLNSDNKINFRDVVILYNKF
jgi:tripartite motif-containing protein 71